MATRRITAAFVQNINHKITGNSVVVKPNELDSALVRPAWKQRYNPQASASQLAASLAFGLIQGHPFIDGNKRTAFWVVNEYLKDIGTNGFTAGTPDDTRPDTVTDAITKAHQSVASGNMDEDGLAREYNKVLGL